MSQRVTLPYGWYPPSGNPPETPVEESQRISSKWSVAGVTSLKGLEPGTNAGLPARR